MDMYPSGSTELLQIEDEYINVQVFGKNLDELTVNRKINLNTPAFIDVISKNNISVKTKQINNELVSISGNQMLPLFFENGQYDFIIESSEYTNLNFIQNGIDINKYFKKVKNITFGFLEFNGDVGYTNIDIYNDNIKVLTIIIEIFPTKMDYKKDYEEMIYEINEEISSIAFNLIDKTYLESKLIDTKKQTNTEFINILDKIFDDFINSLDFIVNNFKHNIIEKENIVSIHKAKKISKNTRNYVRTKPNLLIENKDGFINIGNKTYISSKVIELKKDTTTNIFENQIIKYMIQDIIRRIEYLERLLIKTNGQIYKDIIDSKYKLSKKKLDLNLYLKKYFENISNIEPKNTMSLVFKMSHGYKDAYKKYKVLSKGLDLGDDLFKISPKKIYQLYEMWCYIKFHKILYDLGYDVVQYGIIDYKDNGLYLRLNTDKEASMIYKKDNKSLRLWYNKSYSVPTTIQRPDTVLHIENINSKEKRTYIFDAKYRMKIDANGNESPLEEDINVMHRYRDAIVSETDDTINYKYDTFGAYVMFPCSDEKTFMSNRFYNTIDKVNVGAFPMLPGSTALITNHLKKILSESDLESKDSRIMTEEFDDYVRFKKEDVMVVNVKDQNHLKLYLKNKYYDIPKTQLANPRVGLKYIAFYQPKTTFDEKSGIYYYGIINNIRDMSYNNVNYLRFELVEIKSMPQVRTHEIGPINIIYTTLYLLINAENTRELKVKSSLELKVHKCLREISNQYNLKLKKDISNSENIEQYILDDSTIEIIDGKYIRINGKFVEYRNLKDVLYRHINIS